MPVSLAIVAVVLATVLTPERKLPHFGLKML
jgi:hypothetical protein